MTGQTEVVINTDGSCLGNPGPGGWAAILQYGDVEKVLTGGEAETTNNRMELLAVIMALEALKRPVRAQVISDSAYMKDGITKWINGWKRNGWKTAAKNLSPIRTCGNGLMLPPHSIISHGSGLRDMPAMSLTNAVMTLPAPKQRNQSRIINPGPAYNRARTCSAAETSNAAGSSI